MSQFQLLHLLPEELLQHVLDRVEDRDSFKALTLVSRWGYELAVPFIWKDVTLEDRCGTLTASCPGCRTNEHGGSPVDHDDTPLIKKLIVLATKPLVAACVQTITHQCHLRPPSVFYELPRRPFSSSALSIDPRTIRLVQLAVRNMTKVSSLRIIFGHPGLNDALIRSFFDIDRVAFNPVRRLWIENARISAGCCLDITSHPYDLALKLSFHGLESVRLRRLQLVPDCAYGHPPWNQYIESRAGLVLDLSRDIAVRQLQWLEAGGDRDLLSPVEALYEAANHYDDHMYARLDSEVTSVQRLVVQEGHEPCHRKRSELAYRGILREDQLLEPMLNSWQRERMSPAQAAVGLLASAAATMTSINLDWVFTTSRWSIYFHGLPSLLDAAPFFIGLLTLRFPHLRAFQFRNSVVLETLLPSHFYLLDSASLSIEEAGVVSNGELALLAAQLDRLRNLCIEFLESHPRLRCLAWPLEQFFGEQRVSPSIRSRIDTIIATLGRTLVDLRVDATFTSDGEPPTDRLPSPARSRRRRFIEDFAANMTELTSIKIEGGVPRDERREIIRALHRCPLEKIVLIGICSPIGNTWGEEGRDLPEELPNRQEYGCLEAEDKEAIWQLGPKQPQQPGSDFSFDASYGWPSGPPLLTTIAMFHAETVRELKFCGWKGAPSLLSPPPITVPMLAPLKFFHKLETLIISMRLNTVFEEDARDDEIMAVWRNTRAPSSTAMILVSDEEPTGWEKQLKNNYTPDALAKRVTAFFGPLLSEQTKKRDGGVHLRTSFYVGDSGDIADLDVRIGKDGRGNDVCLGYEGPKDELERKQEKLDARRWF